jgi:hypothetical protein
MRFRLAVLLLCLAVPAQAKPSPYRSVDVFAGDRWFYAQGAGAQDVIKAVRASRKAKGKAKRSKRAPIYAPPLTLAQGARREIARAFGQPAFVRGRLVCAVNVGRALASRGIKGTGSALAKSYLHWGRGSGPVPGAVAVFGRRGGGHVAIVHSVKPNGQVIYLNPSARRQAWVVGPYRGRPIAFRIAS